MTIVDTDDEREPKVTSTDLSHLRDSWPPGIFNHMKWFQQDLELMRKEAKCVFTQSRPMPCKYCGKVICCSMYRHVSRFHLDLAQLWKCPVSWCTVWKGTPQDCMDHLRNAHDVPWISKTASIERFVPPWTVRRELWTELLRLEDSGISTDIMLFSDLGLSLAHHYKVYRGGLPHAAFRGDYITQLRALLPTPLSTNGEPVSPLEAVRGATPKSTRRSHRPFRPVCVMSAAVGDLPVLTIQDPADVVGASVIDCRPPVLPVSILLSALSPRTVENARGTSGFNPSRTGGPQELRDNFDLDLAKVLLDVSVMQTMVSQIEDSVVIETTEIADVPTIETATESSGLALPQESGIVTSWVPRYSPISMASSVGGEARPMSTVQSSPYLLPVMADPPPSCTEMLDQFLPSIPSPLEEPGERTRLRNRIRKFSFWRHPRNPLLPWGVMPIKSADQTCRERDHLRSMMYHRHRGRPRGHQSIGSSTWGERGRWRRRFGYIMTPV